MIKMLIKAVHFQNLELRLATAAYQLQQIRLKQTKGRKVSGPKEAKVKEPRISKRGDQKKLEIYIKPTDNPEFQARVPVDDVWIRAFYPRPTYSLQDILTMHRELLQPCMLNTVDARLYADVELDLSSKKKTKFLGTIKSILRYPHDFDHGQTSRILVICKTDEERDLALSLGAKFAGGNELITQIYNKELERSEYDLVLTTPGMLPEMIDIRGHIGKSTFPSEKRGTVNENIEEMMENISKSIFYESQKTSLAVGHFQVPVAKLDMPYEEIYENLKALFDNVVSLKGSQKASTSSYIKEILVLAPPSTERLSLKLGTEEFQETQQRRKEKVKKEEEEEDQEGEGEGDELEKVSESQ